MTTTTATQPQLTVQQIETSRHDCFENQWTAWLAGNSKVWGTGKTEQAAINDLWIYQGLLAAEGATRIAEGRQVWQEVKQVQQ